MSAIQWFPGHMTRALRVIEASLKSVDMVIEVIDSRIPFTGRSPEVAEVTASKPHILILSKSDLADGDVTARWLDFYRREGAVAASLSSKEGSAAAVIGRAIAETVEKGGVKLKYKPRAMVVGVPNSGKSTLINLLAKSAALKTEDRPGVTRGKQWVVLDGYELLDMPGVLTKRFEDETAARLLAYTGAIRDEVLDIEDVACSLLGFLCKRYPAALAERFKLTADELQNAPYELLEILAARRGMVKRGGFCDTERAAVMLVDEFRAGKVGRVSLEAPQ